MGIIKTDKPLRERNKHDFYPTPEGYVRAHLEYLKEHYIFRPVQRNLKILDPGAGDGIWGKVARELFPDAFICGTELRDLPKPEWYDDWHIVPFSEFTFPGYFDLVIGNPPFSKLDLFIDKCLDLEGTPLLNPGVGILGYLLRLSFLESKKRYNKYFNTYLHRSHLRPREVLVSTRRLSFTGNGKSDDTAYAFYIWKTIVNFDETRLSWMDWSQ